MNDQEFGTCDICGGEFPLARKYYYYDIKCDCCNYKESPHFEIVRYCSTCEPKPPLQVKVHIKPNDLPADYKEITGFNNPEELSAYEKGREDEHKVLTVDIASVIHAGLELEKSEFEIAEQIKKQFIDSYSEHMSDNAKITKFMMWLESDYCGFFLNGNNEWRKSLGYEDGSKKANFAEILKAYNKKEKQ